LERITGLPWPASSFDDAVLEPHQRMLLILLDDHGEVREETRDVARLLRCARRGCPAA
jgi:hypothetical protein